jgi:ATPase subunit of ABC transporter with duplicated ATPase domains
MAAEPIRCRCAPGEASYGATEAASESEGMMTAVIEVTGLTKRYGGEAVVDGISFHVEAGEIFGILGPNGRARPPRSNAWKGCANATTARSGSWALTRCTTATGCTSGSACSSRKLSFRRS